VEKGAPDNHKITYKASADEYINVRTGNVVVQVQEVPHPLFERKTNELKVQVHITLKEALLGFKKTITHLDGHEVTVDRIGIVTKPGLMVRLKGEGMPVYGAYGDYGDMLVTCIVNLPEELT
jgi:DnaJ-related protein SCJ1